MLEPPSGRFEEPLEQKQHLRIDFPRLIRADKRDSRVLAISREPGIHSYLSSRSANPT